MALAREFHSQSQAAREVLHPDPGGWQAGRQAGRPMNWLCGLPRGALQAGRSGGRFWNAAVLVRATQGRVVGLNFHLAQAGQQADQ